MLFRKSALVLMVFLASALPAAAQEEASEKDRPVKAVADRRLAVTTPAGAGALALYLSQDWSRPLPAVARAVVTIHGVLRNADVYNHSAEKALASSGLDPASVLLITPQFLDEGDVAAHGLAHDTLRWSYTGWEGGEDARGPAPISSFAALDAVLAKLADRALFPALKTVIVAGHSGGGQVVQRYAVAGRDVAGIDVRYVVANPSSYAYFTPERPAGDGFAPFDGAACPGYDRWKYGMNALPPYLAGRTAAALEAAYVARNVTYLLGTADTNPNHPALDKSCMGEAQGPYRYARGLAYVRYLKLRHPAGFAHRLLEVPGVGHNGDGMFTSVCGLAAVYDKPGCGDR
jgi:pimeloyl-ACP methyl ester carboxylesterase